MGFQCSFLPTSLIYSLSKKTFLLNLNVHATFGLSCHGFVTADYEVPAFSLDSQFTTFSSSVMEFPLFNQPRYDADRAARFGGGSRDATPP